MESSNDVEAPRQHAEDPILTWREPPGTSARAVPSAWKVSAADHPRQRHGRSSSAVAGRSRARASGIARSRLTEHSTEWHSERARSGRPLGSLRISTRTKEIFLMHHHRALRWAALASILFMAATIGLAQGAPGFHIGVSGGAMIPTENQSDVYNTGWNASLLFPINFGDSPFGIRFDGSYGELTTKDSLVVFAGNGKSRIISGTFDFVVGPHLGAVQPYVIGGVGAYDLRFSGQEVDGGNLFADSTTRFGWNVGAGVAFRIGQSSTQIFVEGRYTSISLNGDRFTNSVHTGGTRFTLIPVNVGVIF